MSRSVRWKGQSIYRPGVYTFHNLAGLTNLDLGDTAAILVIGEADAGQPNPASGDPVYHTFTDPQQMVDTFISGDLAECARFAFDPVLAGQDEDGVALQGCRVVYAIKTNLSTQASFTLQDGSANNAFTLKDSLWGMKGNNTWFKVEVSGTGLYLTCGRDVDPNTGSQQSDVLFSETGVSEWFQIQYTGAGANGNLTFDGTTFAVATGVGGDNLSYDLVTTGYTMEELVALVNAHSNYTCTLLRPDRANTLSKYMNQISITDIKPAPLSFLGSCWDMVAWVNANSAYCEATFVGGFEPQAYTQTPLAGAVTGDTSTGTYTAALKLAKRVPVRFEVNAYDTDAGGGGPSLDTMNSDYSTHLVQCNPIGGRSERQGFGVVADTTKATAWAATAAINNEYMSMVNDQIYREDQDGTLTWLGPHCVATAAAAICAGSPIGTPLTLKYLKAADFKPLMTDFDNTNDTDYAAAINAGLLFMESDPGVGVRFAKGISTYQTEDNDGRIALEVVESRLWMSVVLRRRIERAVIGHKGRGIRTTNQLRGIVIDVLRQLADPNSPDQILVAGTDADGNAVPAYRNVRVELSGDQLYVYADVTFTQGINWVLNDFRATMPSALAA